MFLALPASATEGEMIVTSDSTLTSDHHGVISIGADDVTLDCAGHTVFVPDVFDPITGGSIAGISSFHGRLVVRNCVVRGGYHGFEFDTDDSRFENNEAYGSEEAGFYIQNSSGNVFVDNVASAGAGFYLDASSNNTLVNNKAFEGGEGFYLFDSDVSVLMGNVAWGNERDGFLWTIDGPFEGSNPPDDPSILRGNTAYLNGGYGFFDFSDAWPGGPETGGVWNVYEDNVCAMNLGYQAEPGTTTQSDPEGLCSDAGRFIDDDGNTFEADIKWMAEQHLTKGCDPPVNIRYCPDDPVTRGELAIFLNRIFEYTDDGGGDLFVDDDGRFYEPSADRLKTAGITNGCNPPVNDRYCGDRPVTRGEFAALFVRAMEYTDNGDGNLFTDDDSSPFEKAIDRLATAGVTKGCNPPVNDRFCPDDNMTRGQLAAFLHRALTAP